jgi:hypothetical protein
MDIQTMHTNVKLELDKSSALELPSFEPEEIDFWLNMAIRKFVKTRYSGLNSKKQGFEQSQKRMDDLRTLVASDVIASITLGGGSYPNSRLHLLPSDYWFALQEEAALYITSTGATPRVGILECTIDEYRQKIDDPFSEHKLHYGTAKPLRIFKDDYVELITDGNYSTTTYYLTYLKSPATVDNVPAGTTDCDLPEHTHDEVVKLAANMMLENIEQPRYQTHMNEVNTME